MQPFGCLKSVSYEKQNNYSKRKVRKFMKKLISILVCLAMVLSVFSASAAVLSADEIEFMQENGYLKGRGNGLELDSLVTRAEALTLLLRTCDEENAALNGLEESKNYENDYETVSGTFVRDEENGIVIMAGGQELLITTDNAIFRGDDVNELKEGSIVSAVVSKIRTMSIPAMTNAYLVVVSDTVSVNSIEVEKVEKEDSAINIFSKDGEFIVVADEKTPVSPYATRNIMSIQDVSENDKLFVLSEVMTMSLPARINPVEIIVYQNEFTDDVASEDIVADEEIEEEIVDVESIVGEFVSAEEDGIVVRTENGLVKIDTTSAILEGTSIEEVKEGNLVSAIVSKKQTRSIPAIAKGYAVVISEITSVKYIEVSKIEIEDGIYKIYSEDGEFIVVADKNAVVAPYKTKNIVAISDISEGDKIFVLSDVMTMSIPAQLVANKIIVLEDKAETLNASARAIDEKSFERIDKCFKDTVGHWAEKIINYSYKKGYVDGESEDTFNPEGNVKGRELVKMMLSKVGKEDITIENAYEIAKDFGLITDDALKNVVENNDELKREEVAKLCYNLIKIINPEKIAD